MAVDKLVDSTQLDADLTSVANAIRTKGGTSASLAFPSGFVSAIADIPSGGGGWTEITAASSASNAMTCFILLFPNATIGNMCYAQITNKAQSSYVNNQFIAMLQYHDSNSSYTVAGIRWRSNAYNYFVGANSYDAVINVGDQYKVMEVAL